MRLQSCEESQESPRRTRVEEDWQSSAFCDLLFFAAWHGGASSPPAMEEEQPRRHRIPCYRKV
jgi:hypothetical protein